jgi:hypothetical protein
VENFGRHQKERKINMASTPAVTIHTKKNLFVIQIGKPKSKIYPKPGYLYYHGGDWGPSHSLTQDIDEASKFSSYSEAMDYLLKHWTSDPQPDDEIKIAKIEFEHTKIYKFL